MLLLLLRLGATTRSRSLEFALVWRSFASARFYARIVELYTTQVEVVVDAHHDTADYFVVHFAAYDFVIDVSDDVVESEASRVGGSVRIQLYD
jgi:hypothetical protein